MEGFTKRTYSRDTSIVFKKTKEKYGALSNMAGAFKLRVNDTVVPSSEALYQACRFPHMPEVQKLIIGQHSPMTAKMVSKPYRKETRHDWEDVKVSIMRWCLRVKLFNHWDTFGTILRSTGSLPIVEESRRDVFWGAVPEQPDGDVLSGINALGRLLMELRLELSKMSQSELYILLPPRIDDFLIFGEPIGVQKYTIAHKNIKPELTNVQQSWLL